MRTITLIIVHCSANRAGSAFRMADIDRYHRSLGWMGCGYHYVIPTDGAIEPGRPEEMTGAHCKKVAAFGSLSYFKEENAPAGSTDRCLTCPVAESCRFDAQKAYLPGLGGWPTDVVCLEQTEEALMEALKEGPYGRCVYRCDNNVCDHMSIILEFDNDVTATFSLTAQTSACHRTLHIMCEDGEIVADDGQKQIIVTHHVSSQSETFQQRVINVRTNGSGHGGGDAGIMEDFTKSLGGHAESRSSISRSVESHLMACAIEESRLTGTVVELDKFRKSLA